jgi:hypothetical protein
MTTLTEMKNKLAGASRLQRDQYSGGEERPLRGYLIMMATYGGLVSTLAAAAKATRRPIPDGFSVTDVALCAAATHKLSRLLAKDPVTSPLRAPADAGVATRIYSSTDSGRRRQRRSLRSGRRHRPPSRLPNLQYLCSAPVKTSHDELRVNERSRDSTHAGYMPSRHGQATAHLPGHPG